eukprot:2776092-Rhodomonas_salina.1
MLLICGASVGLLGAGYQANRAGARGRTHSGCSPRPGSTTPQPQYRDSRQRPVFQYRTLRRASVGA